MNRCDDCSEQVACRALPKCTRVPASARVVTKERHRTLTDRRDTLDHDVAPATGCWPTLIGGHRDDDGGSDPWRETSDAQQIVIWSDRWLHRFTVDLDEKDTWCTSHDRSS